jgi:starch-binding outer membrane protein, SusD/RagB family
MINNISRKFKSHLTDKLTISIFEFFCQQCTRVIMLLVIVFCFNGCTKFVDIAPPSTNINADNVFKDIETSKGVVTSMYARMSSSALGPISGLTLLAGLSADEYTLYSAITDIVYNNYYKNQLTSINFSSGTDPWMTIYPVIYIANTCIEGLQASSNLNGESKLQLLAESRFMRGFCYFYLYNLYGDVPLTLTTDYTKNASLPREKTSVVISQIIEDFKFAADNLSSFFVDNTLSAPSADRIRPTKWAAIAMLSRVYLYNGQYENAKQEATKLINNSNMFSLNTDLDQVFLMNSTESIWQLQPVNLGWNTEFAKLFIFTVSGPSQIRPVFLSSGLLSSFEANDDRSVKWIKTITVGGNNYSHVYKYKSAKLNDPVTEYVSVLRLSEQYLIRAEANANLGNFDGTDGAIADLNAIRERAGLEPYSGGSNTSEMMSAILQERRVEFFSEWGNRWLDMKRTATADSIMPAVTAQKGGEWSSTDQLYPIPASEMLKSPQLEQNEGYN